MAELLGDDPDVKPFLAELCRVGMAEAVGVDALVDSCNPGERREQAANLAR